MLFGYDASVVKDTATVFFLGVLMVRIWNIINNPIRFDSTQLQLSQSTRNKTPTTLKLEKYSNQLQLSQPTRNETPTTLKLVHVFSPYSVARRNSKGVENEFYPLDEGQNATFASIIRAWNNAGPDVNVAVYCAVFPEDAFIIPQEHSHIFQTFLLNRSTSSQYPDIQPRKVLPFVNDIWQGASHAAGDYDFMIYTNADIGLSNNFYDSVHDKAASGHDAFVINRLTLPKNATIDGELLSGKNLTLVDEMMRTNSKTHPGTDCFVMTKEIVDSIDFGDLFLGHPPWGNFAKHILKSFAFNFRMFRSKEVLTFHFGEERLWKGNKSWRNLTHPEQQLVEKCPNYDIKKTKILEWTEPNLQNFINCGKTQEYKQRLVADVYYSVPNFVVQGAEKRWCAAIFSVSQKWNEAVCPAPKTASSKELQ